MISSRQNRQIKTIRGLRTCKGRYAFLEGPNLVREMLATGLEFLELLATPDFLASKPGQALVERLGPSGPRRAEGGELADRADPVDRSDRDRADRAETTPLIVTEQVMASITDAGSPQGVLAVIELSRSGVESLPRKRDEIYLFLDRIQDPGNLGALARSAEATSVAGIALASGCAHPNNPKALRASAGSLLRLPVAIDADLDSLLAHLSTLAPAVAALEANGGEGLYETELEGCLVLALGSEGEGLAPEIHSRADLRLTIPTAGPVESLNVTVAASVVLHEIARRRRAGG